MNQIAVVKKLLLMGKSLTAKEAVIEFDIGRLSAVIHEIEKEKAFPIIARRKKYSRNSIGARNCIYAEYYIPDEFL